MLRRLAVPNILAVTLEQAKAHLRVDHSAEDDTITDQLRAAIDSCADYAGRAFDPTEYEFSSRCWPACGYLDLPMAPISSVDGVDYVDEEGATITLEPATWRWSTTPAGARVYLDPDFSLPTLGTAFQSDGREIRITFSAGYIDPAEVEDDSAGDLVLPSQARAAVLLTVGHLYANRESVVIGKGAVPLPLGAKHLLDQIRVYR